MPGADLQTTASELDGRLVGMCLKDFHRETTILLRSKGLCRESVAAKDRLSYQIVILNILRCQKVQSPLPFSV